MPACSSALPSESTPVALVEMVPPLLVKVPPLMPKPPALMLMPPLLLLLFRTFSCPPVMARMFGDVSVSDAIDVVPLTGR